MKIRRVGGELILSDRWTDMTKLTVTFRSFENESKSAYHSLLIKIEPDATVYRYLFTAKSLYMFRVSQHPSSGVLKTVTATSGTGHNTGTADRGRIPIRPRWREVAVPIL